MESKPTHSCDRHLATHKSGGDWGLVSWEHFICGVGWESERFCSRYPIIGDYSNNSSNTENQNTQSRIRRLLFKPCWSFRPFSLLIVARGKLYPVHPREGRGSLHHHAVWDAVAFDNGQELRSKKTSGIFPKRSSPSTVCVRASSFNLWCSIIVARWALLCGWHFAPSFWYVFLCGFPWSIQASSSWQSGSYYGPPGHFQVEIGGQIGERKRPRRPNPFLSRSIYIVINSSPEILCALFVDWAVWCEKLLSGKLGHPNYGMQYLLYHTVGVGRSWSPYNHWFD